MGVGEAGNLIQEIGCRTVVLSEWSPTTREPLENANRRLFKGQCSGALALHHRAVWNVRRLEGVYQAGEPLRMSWQGPRDDDLAEVWVWEVPLGGGGARRLEASRVYRAKPCFNCRSGEA